MSSEGEHKVRAGISIGDFSGIGLEVIMKAFQDVAMLQVCVPVIYGSAKTLSFHRKVLGITEFNYSTIRNIDELNQRKVNLLNVWNEELKIEIGKSSALSGRYAMQSLQAVCKDIRQQKIDVMVTGPVDKHAISQEHQDFTGHTGFLAREFESENHLMILVSELLRVSFVTGHVPVKDVPSLITAENIGASIKTLHKSLKRDFGIRKPKIAVLALNPHAGDTGVIGKEENDVIRPAVKKAFDSGIIAYGPYPADGFFGSGTFAKFDAVLAMYHDQGLVPFKTLSFGGGVNFTAGLPVIRTAPDHGTAFDIAGKNEASEASFRKAVFLACDIWKKRNEYERINKSPLAFASHGRDR